MKTVLNLKRYETLFREIIPFLFKQLVAIFLQKNSNFQEFNCFYKVRKHLKLINLFWIYLKNNKKNALQDL